MLIANRYIVERYNKKYKKYHKTTSKYPLSLSPNAPNETANAKVLNFWIDFIDCVYLTLYMDQFFPNNISRYQFGYN